MCHLPSIWGTISRLAALLLCDKYSIDLHQHLQALGQKLCWCMNCWCMTRPLELSPLHNLL